LSPGDPGYDPGESDFDTQDAYTKFDVSLSYTSADERWGAELFINNATDESIRQETFFLVSGGNESAYVWAPGREAGVRLNFSFD
jgi:iron complex outermembrane receptor protein